MTNTCIVRANHINDRLCDVYKECFNEMIEIAKEKKIAKIVFSLHNDIGVDTPNLVFETEIFNVENTPKLSSKYAYEALSEMVFNESYNHVTLISENLSYAYMEDNWGDFFNIEKIGQIFQAFMEIVGNDDLKDIELV